MMHGSTKSRKNIYLVQPTLASALLLGTKEVQSWAYEDSKVGFMKTWDVEGSETQRRTVWRALKGLVEMGHYLYPLPSQPGIDSGA